MRFLSSRLRPSRIIVFVIIVTTIAFASGKEVVLHSFNQTSRGAGPASPLIADAAGNLYGMTSGIYEGSGYSPGVVYKLTPGKGGTWTETVLHTFLGLVGGYPDGQFPVGSLVFDAAGNLYGVTNSGGAYGGGTVFKLSPTSRAWKESILVDFAGLATGGYPQAGVVLDHAGNLYGTTNSGGTGDCYDRTATYRIGCGTVFELSPSLGGAWSEHILYSFQTLGNDGEFPVAPLAFDAAGNLYGTTIVGGDGPCGYSFPYGCGTVFQLAPNGNGTWTESVLYAFVGPDSLHPASGVMFDAAGNLYGQTYGVYGINYSSSTVFQLTLGSDGVWTEKTIYSPSEEMFQSTLTMDSAGNIYGTTGTGGSCCGTIFELSPNQSGAWTANTLYQFAGGSDGSAPMAGVLRDSAGNLYASASSGLGATCSNGNCGAVIKLIPSSGGTWSPSVLYDFPSKSDGLYPLAGLVADSSGDLYGTTESGGASRVGAVFKMTRDSSGKWQTSILYSFIGANGDGSFPTGSLVFDALGDLYGTTRLGGSAKCRSCGTVFKLSPGSGGIWTESVIYSFGTNSSTDGDAPQAGLVFDTQGNLYGTTYGGGTNGGGTVFELSPTSSGPWTETILHNFASSGDLFPTGSLIFDAKGNLYGTSQSDVFELSSVNGQWQETIVHVFSGGSDGERPYGTLALDSAGNLYGTSQSGGIYGAGTVYELSPTSSGAWTKNILYSFKGVNGDGAWPQAGVVFDSAGNLYGTTSGGGSYTGLCQYGCGTVFKLVESPRGWNERVLYQFTGGADGRQPVAPVLVDSTGNLFGTTNFGGTGAAGAVFQIKL